ncbi:hypothetical protein D3C78_726340 [compost metagenome]
MGLQGGGTEVLAVVGVAQADHRHRPATPVGLPAVDLVEQRLQVVRHLAHAGGRGHHQQRLRVQRQQRVEADVRQMARVQPGSAQLRFGMAGHLFGGTEGRT